MAQLDQRPTQTTMLTESLRQLRAKSRRGITELNNNTPVTATLQAGNPERVSRSANAWRRRSQSLSRRAAVFADPRVLEGIPADSRHQRPSPIYVWHTRSAANTIG